jgi:protein-tyrosine phosphatase
MMEIIDYIFSMRILFVCTANICRSVMAEGILKKLLANSPDSHTIVVSSAGIDALENFTPDQKTLEVCTKRDIHIGSHKARQLTKVLLKETDIVLCMEKIHKQRILGAFPKFIKHVFLLKEYPHKSPTDDGEIKDPIGKPKNYYEKCFKEIEKEVQRILPNILEGTS